MSHLHRGCAAILMAVSLFSYNHTDADLIDLIPGLYGGDGITVQTAPNFGAVLAGFRATREPGQTASFSIGAVEGINRLNEQIAAEIGGVPFNSSVTGFSFKFDPILGDFVSTVRSLGPMSAELPSPVGKGRLSLNLSYTYLAYSQFSGRDLAAFEVVARHEPNVIGLPDIREQFETDVVAIEMDLNISNQIIALSGTYGLFDRLDVGFLLPVAFVDLELSSRARIVEGSGNTLFPGAHSFGPTAEDPVDSASGNASGVSDLLFRAKYLLKGGEGLNIAAAARAQLGTGDRDDFLGTGDNTLRPFLIGAKTFGSLTPHVNVGYEFNLDHDARSAFEYIIGFDYGNSTYAVSGELIGSHELDGDGLGDDIVDTAWGVKWNPTRKLLVGLNARFRVNDAGLRSTVSTTLGMEYGF